MRQGSYSLWIVGSHQEGYRVEDPPTRSETEREGRGAHRPPSRKEKEDAHVLLTRRRRKGIDAEREGARKDPRNEWARRTGSGSLGGGGGGRGWLDLMPSRGGELMISLDQSHIVPVQAIPTYLCTTYPAARYRAVCTVGAIIIHQVP